MSERFNRALQLAMFVHGRQIRKETHNAHDIPLPYITHPVTVATLVQRYDGTEDQIIGGLLHDVLEDGGAQWAGPIRSEFGDGVLQIVEFCTDGIPDALGKKAPWETRKREYLEHLRQTDGPGLLVSACDKLANLEAIVLDLIEHGETVWNRFTAKKGQSLWYYGELVKAFAGRVPKPLAASLHRTFEQVRAEARGAATDEPLTGV